MKVLVAVVLISLISFGICISHQKTVGFAISQVVKHHFANILDNIRIVKCSGSSTEIDGIANEIVKRSKSLPMSFEVFDLKQNQFKGFALNQSAILLFNDESFFYNFFNSMTMKSTSSDFVNILVYCENQNYAERKIEADKRYLNLVFLWERENNFLLTTYWLYSPGMCRNRIETKINEFSIKEMKWSNENFFLAKFENLNGCNLKIGVPKYSTYDFLKFHVNGTVVASGLNVNILEILAEKLNFSPSFVDSQAEVNKVFAIAMTTSNNKELRNENTS